MGPTRRAIDSDSFMMIGGKSIIHQLTELANSQPGKELAESIPFSTTEAEAILAFDATEEIINLRINREDFDIAPFADVDDLIWRLGKSARLDGIAIRKFIPLLENITLVNRIFKAEGLSMSATSQIYFELDVPVGLAELINESIEPDGAICKSATDEIESLYNQIDKLENRIQVEADKFVSDNENLPWLQDSYLTIRENRFVVPVKASSKNKIRGILHDISNSSQTFFIEPEQFVISNNKLRELKIQLNIAIEKFLEELTAIIRAEQDFFVAAHHHLARLDLLLAKAKFSDLINGSRPEFTTCIDLRNVANPLMILAGDSVVRNNIQIEETISGLIISGPNGGGKTVTMLTIGLIMAMAKLGLNIPAAAGSKVKFYKNIDADIGDTQSLQGGLSTFTSHITNIKRFVDTASNDSLFMFDELMVSTDQKEGVALGQAILEWLVNKGVTVIVTTHYRPFKMLAFVDKRFLNIALGIDTQYDGPSFEVIAGATGLSSAIEVASRVGLDDAIIKSAKMILQQDDDKSELILASLRNRLAKAKQQESKAESSLEDAMRIRDDLAKLKKELEVEKKSFQKKVSAKLRPELLRAKKKIEYLVDHARSNQSNRQVVKEVYHELSELEDKVKRDGAPLPSIRTSDLQLGDQVYVLPLEEYGRIINFISNELIMVEVGSINMKVKRELLIGISGRDETQRGNLIHPDPDPDPSDLLDIRGHNVEEALELVASFLDQATLNRYDIVRIIHGKGSGKLRNAVHDYLESSLYVDKFELDQQQIDGSGSTVVTIRN
ncbi:MAG: endonuclease MutS2 [Nitrospinota bacterium]